MLTDFEKHSEWNPSMTKVNDKAAKVEKLDLTLTDPKGGTMVISPTI